MNPFALVVTATALLLSTQAVLASDDEANSSMLAQKARLMWSAFECATFAEKMEDPREQERLFLLGYEQGKQFVEAARMGRIAPEDARKHVPVIVGFLTGGPSPDFVIGRVFENAVTSALEKINKAIPPSLRPDEEVIRSRATNEYQNANCAFLGR